MKITKREINNKCGETWLVENFWHENLSCSVTVLATVKIYIKKRILYSILSTIGPSDLWRYYLTRCTRLSTFGLFCGYLVWSRSLLPLFMLRALHPGRLQFPPKRATTILLSTWITIHTTRRRPSNLLKQLWRKISNSLYMSSTPLMGLNLV